METHPMALHPMKAILPNRPDPAAPDLPDPSDQPDPPDPLSVDHPTAVLTPLDLQVMTEPRAVNALPSIVPKAVLNPIDGMQLLITC